MFARDQKWLKRCTTIAMLTLVITLGACGDIEDPQTTGSPSDGLPDHNDTWNQHFLPDGTYVNCLTSDSGADRSRIRGMSCDWVEYHQRLNGPVYRGVTTPTTLG